MYKKHEFSRPKFQTENAFQNYTTSLKIPIKVLKYALYGGVTGMTPKQFNYLNGYSNKYWGWGCEDEDMAIRISNANMTIEEVNDGRFTMIKHPRDTGNGQNWERFYLLADASERHYRDGLSDLQFYLVNLAEQPLYTHIEVNIGESYLGSLLDSNAPIKANRHRKTAIITDDEIIVDEYRQFIFHTILISSSAFTLYFTIGVIEKLVKCCLRIYSKLSHSNYTKLKTVT